MATLGYGGEKREGKEGKEEVDSLLIGRGRKD